MVVMIVLVLRIVMTMGVHVPCAVGMRVLMLMEDDHEMSSEAVGDAAERLETRNVIAAFQTRDHRLGHAQPCCQLPLRLAGVGTQLEQLARTLRRQRGAVVAARAAGRLAGGLF